MCHRLLLYSLFIVLMMVICFNLGWILGTDLVAKTTAAQPGHQLRYGRRAFSFLNDRVLAGSIPRLEHRD